MTLKETIKNLEQEIDKFERFEKIDVVTQEDRESIAKIRQLAEWLKELKAVHDFDGFKNTPTIEPEIIRCKDCKHKPHPSDEYKYNKSGFEIIFPDYCCPCQCEDEYYNWIPKDDWYCGNGERACL